VVGEVVRDKRQIWEFWTGAFFLAIILHCSSPAYGHPTDTSKGRLPSSQNTDRARLTLDGSGTLRKLELAPLTLDGGSQLTLITPERWRSLAERLSKTLTLEHKNYSTLFGPIPAFKTAVRLMDEDAFYLATGAPTWTNAMFYRGQIILPLSLTQVIDTENLERSLKHEYCHAVIHALSGGKAPGWIDEGLSQWAEGIENPALKPALYQFLQNNSPVGFRLLQGGFTKLDTNIVAAAYAQSFYAAKALISGAGFSAIGEYFKDLRNGKDRGKSFQNAFGLTDAEFEARLAETFVSWGGKSQSPVVAVAERS